MATKRKRTDSEMDEEASSKQGTVSRSGRVRKKSAKLKEMEEGEMALASLESGRGTKLFRAVGFRRKLRFSPFRRRRKGKKKGKAEETADPGKKSPATKVKQSETSSVTTIEVHQVKTEPGAKETSPAYIKAESMSSPSRATESEMLRVKTEELTQSPEGEESGLKMKISLSSPEPTGLYYNETSTSQEGDSENDMSSGEDEDDLDEELGDDDDLEEVDDEDGEDDEETDEDDEEIDVSTPTEDPMGTKSSQALMNVLSQAPGPSATMVKIEGGMVKSESSPVYSNTQEMAMKVKTSAERKAAKRKKSDLPPTVTKTGRLKSKRPTAYTMFCREYREKVFAENPFISPSDFAQISRRLGEIWHTIPEKEKAAFKRKARVYAGRLKRAMTAGALPKKKKGDNQTKHLKSGSSNVLTPEAITSKISMQLATKYGAAAAAAPENGSIKESVPATVTDMVPPSSSSSTIEPIDVAAHMTLLGNSLSIIGANLQEEQGTQAVQGALSVLLDTMLSGLAPLICLTKFVPKLDVIPHEQLNQTLDNIAYIMPGL